MCIEVVCSRRQPLRTPHTLGNRVLVRDIQGGQTSFAQETKEGIFLCWSSDVVHGAKAAIPSTKSCGWSPKRDAMADVKIVTLSGPKQWPNDTKVWKLMENPTDTKQSIWTSSDGRVRWDVPGDTEILTSEERQFPKDRTMAT